MKKVSLIVYNATIYSMDDSNHVYQAMSIDKDRIVGLGTNEEIQKQFLSKKTLNIKGKFLFPGFIDAHAHLLGLGEEKITLDLSKTNSIKQIVEMVKSRVKNSKRNSWILGRGWDQNKWVVHEFPTHEILDSIAPNNPVYLKRIDGHAGWANSHAMRLCYITKSTIDPQGGKILRDKDGEPAGIFFDNAMDLIRLKIPAYTQSELEKMYELAIHECLKVGLTEVHDMGIDQPKISAIKSLIEKKKFPFRLYALIDGVLPEWDSLLKSGKQIFGNQQFILGGLKLYADGALGSRGALLSTPYADDPSNSGILITPLDSIVNEARKALQQGLQVAVHAIGDRANHIVLNAYGSALKLSNSKNARLRIEHVQVLAKEDIPRFSQLGIIASMQPTHCTSDMYWAEARLGPERIKGAYAWCSLKKSGAILVGGSDFPVEDPNPLMGIYAAVTRRDKNNIPASQYDIDSKFQLAKDSKREPERYKSGWYGTEKLTREDAIRMFTSWAAYASFQEKDKGTLEGGKFADFVILNKDLMMTPEKDILSTKVLSTFIGGVEVFNSKKDVKQNLSE